jgi:hypothetical protein
VLPPVLMSMVVVLVSLEGSGRGSGASVGSGSVLGDSCLDWCSEFGLDKSDADG